MANVQLENGYTKIANEILEEIAKIKLSPTQYRILFIIWRYTYGFNRKWHDMSLSFLSKATGCDSRQIQRELKRLEERRVILPKIKSGSYRKISFNKNHDEWVGKTDIGEIDNGTIGQIDNQEIHKEKSKKKGDMHYYSASYFEYEKIFGKPSKGLVQAFNYWINNSNFQEPEEIICETINRTKMHKPNNPKAYVKSILKKLHDNKLYTLTAVKGYNTQFYARFRNKNSGGFPSLGEMFNSKNTNESLSEEELLELEELEKNFPFRRYDLWKM